MPVRKVTVSIAEELDQALILASIEMKMNKSRLVDTLLREHPRIAKCIEIVRAEPDEAVLAGPGPRTRAALLNARLSSSGPGRPTRGRR